MHGEPRQLKWRKPQMSIDLSHCAVWVGEEMLALDHQQLLTREVIEPSLELLVIHARREIAAGSQREPLVGGVL